MIGPLCDMFTAAMFFFFYEIPICANLGQHSISYIILWKWASMLTKLAWGWWRLAWFHVIRSFFANKIYRVSMLSHQTGCLFTLAARSI